MTHERNTNLLMQKFREWFFIGCQHILPQHCLSRLIGYLARCKIIGLKNWAINKFIVRYGVNMQEALYENAQEYENFNQFFTRALKPNVRPIELAPNKIISPVDGMISEIGQIDENRLLQAKGHDYKLEDLLAGDEALVSRFRYGNFATFYLAPKDYHCIHMPLAGVLRQMIYVPGKLFSVNTVTTQNVPNLFARNERVITVFDTDVGSMAVILVGAMIVASMSTVWSGVVAPKNPREITHFQYDGISLDKGMKLGHFELGSTVIVLFGPKTMNWDPTLKTQSIIQMGQFIGQHAVI